MKSFISLFFLTLYLQVASQNSEIQYLTGTSATDTKTWEFYCSAGMQSGSWKTIEVPSCWEQQGFGSYSYGHDTFEERLKETGHYKYRFAVPKDWKSKHVDIVFEGVMTEAEVKINGKLAGEVHQGAFYEFKYNISKLLKYEGSNTIEVYVKKFSGNTSVNYAERKADFWVFGGIFRPVYLKASPKKHITHVAIDARANGVFTSDINLSSHKGVNEVEVSIETLEGKTLKQIKHKVEGLKTRISTEIDAIETWNPEAPNLYNAVYSLKSGDDIIHKYTERFGFRTVEVKESDGIYINGVKVKLKGVNRHTFHPDYARTSSKALSIEAVKLMKEMNMNAVRMSHYPPEKHFLEVCDSLGLFVLDELAGWHTPSYDDEVGLKLLSEMIRRDVNHPSIILWDNGNESGWNYKLDDDFAKLDIQKRTVIHPWQSFGKINAKHYIDYNFLALDGYEKRKIFLPTEFLHGLYDGGHGAGLEDYWHRIWNHPQAAGGFLWVFADEGIARTDRNGALDFDGNHAPDGILGAYLQKEASFYTIKKVWSPIHIEKRYITADFDGTFRVENRYHFTNLETCTFDVEWLKYDQKGEAEIVSKESLKVQLRPEEKGTIKITLPQYWDTTHNLKITARDGSSNTIAVWSYPVRNAAKAAKDFIDSKATSKVQFSETENSYRVNVGPLSYAFSKNNGTLELVKNNGTTIPLSNGPIFVSTNRTFEDLKATLMDDGGLSIIAKFEKGKDSIIWKVRPDGRLELRAAYQPAKRAPHVGITFSFPENEIEGMAWMGQGPYRVWKNRNLNDNFGIWNKRYNNGLRGNPIYEYPEFKGYHSEIYWVHVKTKTTSDFKVHVLSDDIFLKMLTPNQPKDGRKTLLEFPPGDLSFLHGINAIGTKFTEASELGPQTADNYFNASNKYGEKLRLYLLFDFDL